MNVSLRGRGELSVKAMLGLCLVATAQATARGSIDFGTDPINNVENVLFKTNQAGSTLFGSVDNGSGTNFGVKFTQPSSGEKIETGGIGHAKINPVDDVGFTSLRTELIGGVFTRISINPMFVSKDLTFTAVTDDGSSQSFISKNGQNRLWAEATGGDVIKYLDITGPANTIESIRQVRIGGISPARIDPAAVPEPPAWMLLTAILMMAGCFQLVMKRWKQTPVVAS